MTDPPVRRSSAIQRDAARLASLEANHVGEALVESRARVFIWVLVPFVFPGLLFGGVVLLANGFVAGMKAWFISGMAFAIPLGIIAALFQAVRTAHAGVKDARVVRERRAIVDASEVAGAVALAEPTSGGELELARGQEGELSERS